MTTSHRFVDNWRLSICLLVMLMDISSLLVTWSCRWNITYAWIAVKLLVCVWQWHDWYNRCLKWGVGLGLQPYIYYQKGRQGLSLLSFLKALWPFTIHFVTCPFKSALAQEYLCCRCSFGCEGVKLMAHKREIGCKLRKKTQTSPCTWKGISLLFRSVISGYGHWEGMG